MRVTSIVAALIVLGCSASAFAQGGAAASATCALAASPGVAEQKLTSGGRERAYRLFVPPGYDGRTSLPLVLDLHG